MARLKGVGRAPDETDLTIFKEIETAFCDRSFDLKNDHRAIYDERDLAQNPIHDRDADTLKVSRIWPLKLTNSSESVGSNEGGLPRDRRRESAVWNSKRW